MKQLILKFKHWLIRKLGGYTEQHIDNRRVDVHSHQLRPIVLRTEIHIHPYIEPKEHFDVIKAELACQLAHKLIDEKLYNIECRDDPILQERVYRAELFLIHPHDAAMCSLTRREEL